METWEQEGKSEGRRREQVRFSSPSVHFTLNVHSLLSGRAMERAREGKETSLSPSERRETDSQVSELKRERAKWGKGILYSIRKYIRENKMAL